MSINKFLMRNELLEERKSITLANGEELDFAKLHCGEQRRLADQALKETFLIKRPNDSYEAAVEYELLRLGNFGKCRQLLMRIS
jgi:hypothetical protein